MLTLYKLASVGSSLNEHVCVVKVVTQIYFESNKLLTLGDRGWVSMEHQSETAYLESNRHVINDVTCVVTPICFGLNISQTAGDTDSVTMDHL